MRRSRTRKIRSRGWTGEIDNMKNWIWTLLMIGAPMAMAADGTVPAPATAPATAPALAAPALPAPLTPTTLAAATTMPAATEPATKPTTGATTLASSDRSDRRNRRNGATTSPASGGGGGAVMAVPARPMPQEFAVLSNRSIFVHGRVVERTARDGGSYTAPLPPRPEQSLV